MPKREISPEFKTDAISDAIDACIQRLTHQEIKQANEARETKDLNALVRIRDALNGKITYLQLCSTHFITNHVIADLFCRYDIISEDLKNQIKHPASISGAPMSRHM